MLINIWLYYVFSTRHQQLTKLLSRHINEPIHQKPRESHGKYDSVVFIIHVEIKTRMMMMMMTMAMIIVAL